MKEVNDLLLSDGSTYSGAVQSDGYEDVPHGVGICRYEDHNELGVFKDGVLNGIAYLNYHDWMYVGMCKDRLINGWGMKVDKGEILFGVCEDSVLKVNLTPLVEIFWHKILEETGRIGKSAISVLKSGEIFVGAPQYLLFGKFGFHFLGNGEVFLGRCDYGQKGRTGKFLHFDLDYNITKCEFKDGKLVREIDDDEFISACEVFVNHAYLDFDIKMNYSIDSFLFGEKKILHIIEMGKTPDNLIIKANICNVIGNRLECESDTNDNTLWLMYPVNNSSIENRLIGIANSDEPWIPDFSDYRIDFYNNFCESSTSHQVVYKHVSCWDEEALFDLNIFDDTDPNEYGADFEDDNEDKEDTKELFLLIPDFGMKKTQLEEQWIRNGWYYTYPSVRDYVKSLAYDDDVNNFFGWLFNDYHFNNTSVWSLPSDYEMALEQFFNLFFDLDD